MADQEMLSRRFEASRPKLLAIATRLLGSSADADDAVQEAWLRLDRTDTDQVQNLDAWLVTTVSRLCLDSLRSARRRHERSWQITPWDEPALEDSDPLDQMTRADMVTAALLVVLDTLTPPERLAFVLHDVFGQPFDEVARTLARSPAAARQLASRARRQIQQAGTTRRTRVERERERELVEAWLRAVSTGDLVALSALLADDAVLHADYGSTTQDVTGRDDIARQATLAARLARHSVLIRIDGNAGVAATFQGRVVSVMAFEFHQDRITQLAVLADPARIAASMHSVSGPLEGTR